MVTLTPTSITNKDMATLNLAMVTTPCTATLPPTMASVSPLLVTSVIMELGLDIMALELLHME